jgi:hypothetical protein
VIIVLMLFGTERRGVDLAGGGRKPEAFAH